MLSIIVIGNSCSFVLFDIDAWIDGKKDNVA